MRSRLANRRWMAVAALLILSLGACGGGETESLLQELDEIDVQGLEGQISDQDQVVEDAGTPSEVQFSFILEIHRLGHITNPGVDTVLEERASVEIWGEGDLFTGQVLASGTMTNLLGQPCEMVCEYELEFVVNGWIENPPTCEFIMNVIPSPGPGTCTSDCPTEGFTIPFYGVTDQTLDKVVFHQEEIGFRTIDVERVTSTQQLGNLHWLNTFSISDFTGKPVVPGCQFDF
jgi:hypothetical protein